MAKLNFPITLFFIAGLFSQRARGGPPSHLSLDEIQKAEKPGDLPKVPNPSCAQIKERFKDSEEKKRTFLASAVEKNASLLFLGESHGDAKTACLMADSFPALAKAGYGTLALEVNDKYEKFFKLFNKEKDFDRAFAILVDNKVPLAKFAREDGTVSEIARDFFRSVKVSGLEIHAVDRFEESSSRPRDQIMARHIRNLLKKGKRVIYYVGSNHARKLPDPDDEATKRTNAMSKTDGFSTNYRILHDPNLRGVTTAAFRFTEQEIPADADPAFDFTMKL